MQTIGEKDAKNPIVTKNPMIPPIIAPCSFVKKPRCFLSFCIYVIIIALDKKANVKTVYPIKGGMTEIKPIIAAHHERLDGSGYPRKLKDNQIPELSKIIAVTDSYDVMTSTRVYNKVKTSEEALEDLFSNTINYGENKYSYKYVKALSNCIKK